MKKYLNITDTVLLKKLEYFIYEYVTPADSNFEDVMGYAVEDYHKNRANIKLLTEKFSDYKFNDVVTENELEKIIDSFIFFLKTNSFDTTVYLNNLLDMLSSLDSSKKDYHCVKRLAGILSAIYLAYFFDDLDKVSKSAGKKMAIIKDIFKQHSYYCNEDDKDFLTKIFIFKRKYSYQIILLSSYLEKDQNNKYTDSSINIMVKKFFELCNQSDEIGIIELYDRGKKLFQVINEPAVLRSLEIEKANILFKIEKYSEAELLLEKYIKEVNDENRVYDLYNIALCYRAKALHKERNDFERQNYINKALKFISSAENFCRDEIKLLKQFIVLEKAFLLFEIGDSEQAFVCVKQVLLAIKDENMNYQQFRENSYTRIIRDDFFTCFWILMKYMCLHEDDRQLVIKLISFINHVSFDVRNKKWPNYYRIVEHTMMFIKTDVLARIHLNVRCNLLKLLFYAMEIKNEVKIYDVARYNFLYYTKIQNLKLLLEDEANEKCKYRLPMFHIYHMNDPQEGKIFEEFLKNKKVPEQRKKYYENYVFLKSFFCYEKTDNQSWIKEFLPMWVQYANDAEGCCVILNSRTFKNCDLQKIIYLNDEGKCDNEQINLFLDEFKRTYHELHDICNNINCKQNKEYIIKIKSLMSYIVSQISYLFKHEAYKHENEVRILVSRMKDELDDVRIISGDVPETYIYNEVQTYIDEVILGPKIKNPEDYVPFIHKQGNKMWKDENNKQIRVTQSTIQYR